MHPIYFTLTVDKRNIIIKRMEKQQLTRIQELSERTNERKTKNKTSKQSIKCY